MLTLKCIIGLFCLLYPTRVEGLWQAPRENPIGGKLSRGMVHADQMTCGTIQALIHGHAS